MLVTPKDTYHFSGLSFFSCLSFCPFLFYFGARLILSNADVSLDSHEIIAFPPFFEQKFKVPGLTGVTLIIGVTLINMLFPGYITFYLFLPQFSINTLCLFGSHGDYALFKTNFGPRS